MPGMEAEGFDISRAEELKVRANEAFKAHKYAQSIELYTQAIERNGQNAVYWANRSFAHLKLEEYGSAIQDASKAIEVDPKYSKGYYRRGAAYLAMGKFKDALKDFQQVKKLRPNDPDATRKLKECEKAVKKLKFEEAISVPVSQRRSVAESIDYHTIGGDPSPSSMPTEVALGAVAVAVVAAVLMIVGTTAAIVVSTILVGLLMVLGACWWSGLMGGIHTKSRVHDLGLSLQ